MAALNPFTPGSSFSLFVSSVSARVALPATGGDTLRTINIGTAEAFINFGDSTVTATGGNNMSMPGSRVDVFTIPGSATNVAAVSTTGTTTTLRFTKGWGA